MASDSKSLHAIPSFGQSLGLLLDSGKKKPTRGANAPKTAKAQESVTDGSWVGLPPAHARRGKLLQTIE